MSKKQRIRGARGNNGDFHRFLSIAKGSCAEVRSQLYVALDIGYLDQISFDELITSANEVNKLVGGLRAYIERQRNNSK
jgi:four helix bundle protein